MRNHKLFININTITIGSVFLLILVGSIVRSTGAGMGCPDWPKCFGAYIPPLSADELPENYQEVYREQRLTKNVRLANVLSAVGYETLGRKITSDPDVLEEHEFNTTKAWIEYINRLIGVVIGLLVFLNLVMSFRFWSYDKRVVLIGLMIFLLTGFQGWIGSLVVSTNLLHGFISVHMMLTLLIVALLLLMNFIAKRPYRIESKRLFWLCIVGLLLFIPQILLGTEVRGTIDDQLVLDSARETWASFLSVDFLIHRSYSWLILIVAAWVFIEVRKQKIVSMNSAATLLLMLVVAVMFAGLVMARFSFPLWSQPVHLVLACGIFSVLFYMTLKFSVSK